MNRYNYVGSMWLLGTVIKIIIIIMLYRSTRSLKSIDYYGSIMLICTESLIATKHYEYTCFTCNFFDDEEFEIENLNSEVSRSSYAGCQLVFS